MDSLAPEFGREHKEFMDQICNPLVPSVHRNELLKRGRLYAYIVRPRQVLGRSNIRGELSYDTEHPSLKTLFAQGGQMAEKLLRAMGAKEVTPDPRPIRGGGFPAPRPGPRPR